MDNSMPTMMAPPSDSNGKKESESKKSKITPFFEILEQSVSLWWKNLNKILLIYWEAIKILAIPFLIAVVLYAIANWMGLRFLIVLFSFIWFLFMAYYLIRAYMAVYLLIRNHFNGEANKLFKETKDLFWPYLGLSLLAGILILLWTLLLIIPGIIFAVFYSLAEYVFFSENKRGMEAIKRSKSLVKGYFWPVFGRLLLLIIIVGIFMSILTWPIDIVKNLNFIAFWNILVQVVSFLITPIVIIFMYRIYNDLVKIKK